MARRKKGRDISGWIVIDKPVGLTSNTVVGKVRHAFQAKKAGHAGTLDPAATGVLAIALGEATKTVPYIVDALKTYEFTVRLGIATNTDDADGEVIETSDLRPDDAAIETALGAFRGDIMQVPPAFSAVKVDGERAYAKARAGDAVELAARPLHVAELDIVDRPDADHLRLRMVCGKGGYVRSIARDLGLALGCLGHVTELRRTASGPFAAEGAVTLEGITGLAGTEEIDTLLLPLEVALEVLPEARCTALAAERLRHGNPGEITHTTAGYGDEAWASHGGQAVAVGIYRAGMLHPSRVFVA
ncbi:tRNA pseudouridine(55) synthase TruB [Ovoidimarina sediminis]|uniref:tRNA pseudouridine(55) synthase TruB n=1 Tax=Ovoidimarina sediminis TaxID=3079856 RepID=UPI00290CB900|nr:tRNA pseudouridine(55) synthase TruB [Rhodophyticola sp. MJ-SS7]MDU8943825.1 tRNA pseudouridine(55) synthase TruB [Rhodophyticola sp. MJ-SS7]